jgi:hypothetical protein
VHREEERSLFSVECMALNYRERKKGVTRCG